MPLTSPESIKQMVAAADAGGFNTVLVQVRGRGDAYYSATLEPRASELASKPTFDPLAEVIEHAHANGIKVHAWVAVNLVSELRQPAGVARSRRLPRAGVADGAARAGRGNEEDRFAQPRLSGPAGAMDPHSINEGRGPLYLAAAWRGAGSHRRGDR